MNPLRYTVAHMDGETAMSLVSRLAAANGIDSVIRFCEDMGLSIPDLRNGKSSAISMIAMLSGTDADILARSTPTSIGDVTFRFGRHDIYLKHLWRRRLRICPKCTMEDLANGAGRPEARPWIRSGWSIAFVRTCPKHRVFLQDIAVDATRYLAEDLCFAFRTRGEAIRKLAEDAQPGPESGLENWMSEAMSAGSNANSSPFLSSMPFALAVRFAELIGAGKLYGRKFPMTKLTNEQWFEAGRAGYDIVAPGKQNLLDYLTTLHDRMQGKNGLIGGFDGYGTFYSWLWRAEGKEFEPLKAMVREHVIDSFPIGPGNVFLGEVTRRKWHSLHSASREHGISPKRIRRLFTDSGIIGRDTSKLSDHRVLFDAEATAPMLARIKDGLDGAQARALMGMTFNQWTALVQSGLIEPIIKSSVAYPIYAKEDLQKLLSSMRYSTVGGRGEDMVELPQAVRPGYFSLLNLMRLLRAGRLDDVWVDEEKDGLFAIHVSMGEIRKLAARTDLGLQPDRVSVLKKAKAEDEAAGWFPNAIPRRRH